MEHIVITAVLKPKEGLQVQLLSELKKVTSGIKGRGGLYKVWLAPI